MMAGRVDACALGAVCLCLAASPALANSPEQAPPAAQQEQVKKWGPLGPVYDLAVRALEKGQYEDAIKLLKALKRDDHPHVLNSLGYAYRKSGQAQDALPYYEKALSIAPDFTQAREYLGEAWLQLGEPVKAWEQLAEIEKYCGGTECDDYQMLKQAIDAHVSQSSSAAGSQGRDSW
jgi:tetratricopeptide (TPR) repeat protein